MLTKKIDFFGKEWKVNVSSVIPIKYNFEFKKDLHSFLNGMMKLNKEGISEEDFDLSVLNDCIEVAYVMLKYAKNEDFNYQSYENYLENYNFMDLAKKSLEIVTLYISGTVPTFPPRTKSKKKKKKGR